MARALRIWLVLLTVSAAVLFAALAFGSSPIALADLPRLLFAPDGSVASEVVHNLRLPRALAALPRLRKNRPECDSAPRFRGPHGEPAPRSHRSYSPRWE